MIAGVMQGHLKADNEFFDTAAILDVLRRHGVQTSNNYPKSKPLISGSEAPAKGGTTPDSAIRIHAANSIEGIPKEYAVLKAMFGVPNQDWKLIGRSVLDTDADGRRLERFIISAAGNRREIYFDVTEWFKGNTSKEAKAAPPRVGFRRSAQRGPRATVARASVNAHLPPWGLRRGVLHWENQSGICEQRSITGA